MKENIIKKQLRIGGMTCINCQNKIEKALRNTPGIQSASVRYTTGLATITYDPGKISWKEITKTVEKLHYRVLPDQASEKPDLVRIVSFLVIIVSLYVLLEWFGVLNLLVPSQLADSGMGYGMLFIIGLLTSVHCIAMCGGINLSQCVPTETSERGRLAAFRPALLYNLGRVISYTVIGFLLGLVGLLLGGGSSAGLSVLFQGILKLIAGALMVIMGVNLLGLFPWLRRLTPRIPAKLAGKAHAAKARSRRPLVVGLLNGLMPCGPLQSMQIVALASGNPLTGALSMLLFSLGTVPLMLGLGSLVSALGQKFSQAVMQVGGVLVAVLGLAMLSQGGSLSGLLTPDRLLVWVLALCLLAVAASLPFRRSAVRAAGLAAAVCLAGIILFCRPSAGTAQSGAAAALEDGTQVVYSTLSSSQYPSIQVQAGTPVKWVIDAPKGSINGCNYKLIIPAYGIEYAFQEGENIIEFTPEEAGTVTYSCWMGMIRGSITVTDSGEEAADVSTEAPAVWSCCGV